MESRPPLARTSLALVLAGLVLACGRPAADRPAAAAPASGAGVLPGIRITTADAIGDTIEFDAPVAIAWDSVARAQLPDLSRRQSDTAFLAAHYNEMRGAAIVRFRVPVLPAVPVGWYTGLGSRGITPLEVVEMAGEARLGARPPRWEIEGGWSAAGRLRAVSPGGPVHLEVPFVLWSRTPLALHEHAATVEAVGDSIRVTATGRAGTPSGWSIGLPRDGQSEPPRTIHARLAADRNWHNAYVIVFVDYGERATPCLWYAILLDAARGGGEVARTAACDV
ncbi:MAG: hypothetical protein U9Q74_14040 [Gemmatimonadota bacterium]|nr:hypothetical protein [Gemmatimonadota bacterium]